jgi:hypothetical protein
LVVGKELGATFELPAGVTVCWPAWLRDLPLLAVGVGGVSDFSKELWLKAILEISSCPNWARYKTADVGIMCVELAANV